LMDEDQDPDEDDERRDRRRSKAPRAVHGRFAPLGSPWGPPGSLCGHHAGSQAIGSTRMSIAYARSVAPTKMRASTRSKRPPCPGMILPESFTPTERLSKLSARSPT